jgi:predicted glycoside hydrolase/deacetylase ChbG (UPF0249 family)
LGSVQGSGFGAGLGQGSRFGNTRSRPSHMHTHTHTHTSPPQCNGLVRRLSKTHDTEWCGRVLMFLTAAYPLSERSAVNVKGESNTLNVTSFEAKEQADLDYDEVRADLLGELPRHSRATHAPLTHRFRTTLAPLGHPGGR